MDRLRLLAVALFVFVQVGASTCQDASTIRLSEVFPSITRLDDYFPGGVIPQDVIPLDVLNVSAPCMMALAAIPTGMKATPWGLQMLDASSKLQSGILEGNTYELGNFDECVAVRAITNLTSPFQGKHCLSTITMGMKKETPPAKTSWEVLGRQLMAARALEAARAVPKQRAEPNLRAAGGMMGMGGGLRMSFCVPSTCSAKDVQDGLNSALSYVNVTFVQLAVTEADCRTDEGPSLRTKDWIAIVILMMFGVMLITSTVYDLGTKNVDDRRPLLLAFSVYSNGKRLLSTSSGGRDNLPSLHGIRFLSLAWVILGHTYMASIMAPAINATYLVNFMKDWKRIYILNATISVDTFFLLSGLLVSYVFLNQMAKKGARFNIFLFYIHRYVRLTPAFAIVIMLNSTLYRYMGSGPLWNTNPQVTEESCNTYWWSALLYVQNYVNPMDMCVGQSWYLSVDMQLFWLSPIVLIPLWKRPKLGVIWLVLLIFAGIASAFTVAYINKLLPFMMGMLRGMDPEFNVMKDMYVNTYTRFSPWLIGVALGYVLHILRGKELRIPKWAVALGWFLAALSSIGSFVGIYPYLQEDFVYNRVGDSLYDASFRSLWVLGVAWVIFACTKGYGGPVNTILSWNVWQPLSRLCYTMYLTHMQYQILMSTAARTPIYVGDAYVIPMFFADVVIAVGFATCLSLTCESPAIILEKVLLTPGGGQDKKKSDIPVAQNGLSTNPAVDRQPV